MVGTLKSGWPFIQTFNRVVLIIYFFVNMEGMKGKYRHSVTIAIKRPPRDKYDKFEPMTDSKVKLRPNRSYANATAFNLPKEEILAVNKLKRTTNLLPFKLFMTKQDGIRFKKRIAISIFEKHRINCHDIDQLPDIGSRLEASAATDVDGLNYKWIDGRPLACKDPVFKSLKILLSNFIRTRQESAYKRDCVLNIDVDKMNEEHAYGQSAQRLSVQVNYFDRYISEDYRKSMCLLTKWEDLEHSVDEKAAELQRLANEMFSTKSRLVSLDYQYSQQQKYGRFLYYLSPPMWRTRNREFASSVEIEARGFDYDESHDEDTFAVIFQKLSNICYGEPVRPALFFDDPGDLVRVFDAMESQQLHYFSHVTHLTPYIEHLKGNIKRLKELIVEDSVSILNVVRTYERHLEVLEATCLRLKSKLYRILFGMFYDAVGSADALKLKLHLEFCFEKVLLDKPTNMDIVAMFKHLEGVYHDYSYRLDNVRGDAVRRAVSKCRRAEAAKVARATRASKELRLFYRLETQLLHAYGFEHSNASNSALLSKKRLCDSRSRTKRKLHSPETQTRESLTADEFQYLALFTDWTENEDPVKYLQRLSD